MTKMTRSSCSENEYKISLLVCKTQVPFFPQLLGIDLFLLHMPREATDDGVQVSATSGHYFDRQTNLSRRQMLLTERPNHQTILCDLRTTWITQVLFICWRATWHVLSCSLFNNENCVCLQFPSLPGHSVQTFQYICFPVWNLFVIFTLSSHYFVLYSFSKSIHNHWLCIHVQPNLPQPPKL